jgi:hypothetical protein
MQNQVNNIYKSSQFVSISFIIITFCILFSFSLERQPAKRKTYELPGYIEQIHKMQELEEKFSLGNFKDISNVFQLKCCFVILLIVWLFFCLFFLC